MDERPTGPGRYQHPEKKGPNGLVSAMEKDP
jgi:hypothetical protein